jgi:spheroidene monooxygenase
VPELSTPLRAHRAPVAGADGAGPWPPGSIDPQLATGPEPVGASGPAGPAHAVLHLTHYLRGDALWGLSRLVLGRRGVGPHPGLRFARVLGSGRDGGFGLVPSLRHQGLFAMFDDEASAFAFAHQSRDVAQRASRSDDSLLAVLAVTSARGAWDGVSMRPVRSAEPGQPVAALTRASIRPRHATTFWGHTPGSQRALARAQGCGLAVGLGEAPLLRQATFSLWESAEAMQAYARQGAHGDAARRALGDGWFSEWMFVRFVPLLLQGSWHGRRFG